MPQNVALSNSSTPVSSFSIFSPLQSLTSKVNGVFGVYLTIALGFFFYYGYKCYQSLQLYDELKGVKCKVLLKEIENQLKLNAHADVAALVQECEALRNSMDRKKDPDISQGLVDYYAKKDPNKAFLIADRFFIEKELFDACESIHKANPGSYPKTLSELLNRAYKSRFFQPENPIAKVKRFLMYAKLAHSIDENSELKVQVLIEAINTATECGGGLAQANACCEVDKVCKELGSNKNICDTDKFKSFLRVAKQDSEQAARSHANFSIEASERDASELASLQKAAFEAHLTLAKVQFLYGEDNHEALGRARCLFDQGISQDFELLASVYAESGLNNEAREVLKQICANYNNDVETYLRLASAYQKHDMQDEADQALDSAKAAFTYLPEETDQEIESKFDLMKRFSSWEIATDKQVKKVLGLRELCYRANSDEPTQQKMLIQHIQFCNRRAGLEETINDSMKLYLLILEKTKQNICDKISELVKYATTLSPEHGTKMLKAAEMLLPKVPSRDYAKMTTLIAEAYLGTNIAKSRELFDHAKSSTWNHGLSAVIPVIAIPIVRAYPQAGFVCFAAYAVRQMLL